MRIAILAPYFWPEMFGIEKVIYAHARHLALRGHTVRVFTSRLTFPSGVDGSLPDRDERDGFSIRRLRVSLRGLPLIFYPSNSGFMIYGLREGLEEFEPEIVHAHNVGAAAWAHIGAKHARKRMIPFFYSTHYHPSKLRFSTLRKWLLQRLNHLPLKTAARIYHLTKRDYDTFGSEYRYAPSKRFAVLRNGVEPPQISPIESRSGVLNVLFVGRVDDVRKGFAVLESALGKMHHRDRMRLIVIGRVDADKSERLRHAFGDSIEMRGFVDEVELEAAYASADIFVMPSLYEGFGMPYIEAMRFGVPVIGSDAGGIPEVVPAGTGLLTEPGDASAVAEALDTLIADRAYRHSIGDAGKAWAKNFFWENIVDELEGDYIAADARRTP